MDILPSQSRLIRIREFLFSINIHTVLGFVEWLIGFFRLTKEDQLKAGIYTGGESRDIKFD